MIGVLAQGGAASYDWADEFQPFTAFHWVVAGACLTLIAGSLVLGIFWRGTSREARLRRSWAVLVLAVQAVLLIYYMLPPTDIGRNLPLQICDLAGWIAGFALITLRRWLRAILYYWGIVLSTQAFFTPVLEGENSGYVHPGFWAFWVLHLMIIGSAVYDLVVLRFRPTWADLKSTIVITGAYAAAIFLFNLGAGTNYLYIGNETPKNPTIVDTLGGWPLRALWVSLIVVAGFVLFTAIWPSNWKRGSRP